MKDLLKLASAMAPKKCPVEECTAEFEDDSFGPLLMHTHLAMVHSVSIGGAAMTAPAAPAANTTTNTKQDDSCVYTVEKARNEMSQCEWNSWHNVWRFWRESKPKEADYKVLLLSKFPKIVNEVAALPDSYTMKEEEVLKHIKSLIVTDSSIITQRKTMQQMKQAYDETVSNFLQRLTVAANACDYFEEGECKKCNTMVQVEYREQAIRDAFFNGLYDKDIVEKICWAFKNKIPTLREMFNEAQSIELSRKTAARQPETVAAVSTYKQQAKADQKPDVEYCDYCKRKGHNVSECRRKQKRIIFCKKCNTKHQANIDCKTAAERRQQSTQPAQAAASTANNVAFMQQETCDFDGFIFNVRNEDDNNSVPRIRIQLTPENPTTYATVVKNNALKKTDVNALADSGAAKCIIQEAVWCRMGGSRQQMLPSTARLQAANGAAIKVTGEAQLKLTVADCPTNSITTTVSIVPDLHEEMIISKGACVDLKILPHDFPKVRT